MTTTHTFDETKHPRDPSGQFTTKPASESEVALDQGAGTSAELRAAGLEALGRWPETDDGIERSARAAVRDGLVSVELDAQLDGVLAAAQARRLGIGPGGDDLRIMMHGTAPHLTDEEATAAADEIGDATERTAQLVDLDQTPHPEDGQTVRAYRDLRPDAPEREGSRDELLSAWHARARREAERAVACSRERANPLVTIPAAPVPDDPDHEEYKLGAADPDRLARWSERRALTDLGAEVYFSDPDAGPEGFDSATIERSRPRAEVASVLVQRGRHPDDAGRAATAITRAAAMEAWYSESESEAVYDADEASIRTSEVIVPVSHSEVTDWVTVPPAEDPADPQYWAEANRRYWTQEADDLARTALGHPVHRRASR